MFKKVIVHSSIIFLLVVLIFSAKSYTKKISIIKDELLSLKCEDCNIVLISIDTLRSKSIPCYGYEKNTSPHLCEFAKGAYLFSNTYSQSSFTLDSHFATMTSLYPSSHGVTKAFEDYLSTDIKTLAQILKESGYTTMYQGILTDSHLPLNRGLERGFEIFQEESSAEGWNDSISGLKTKNNKFFIFLHTYHLHDPYTPDKDIYEKLNNQTNTSYISGGELCAETLINTSRKYPREFNLFLKRYSDIKNLKQCDVLMDFRDFTINELGFDHDITFRITLDIWYSKIKPEEYLPLYEAEIFEVDADLKKLFDHIKAIDLLGNTIIIIMGDHGEAFGEHGRWRHVNNIYNETIKIPLIIYVPGAKGAVINKLAQSIDVVPSILHLIGHEETYDQFQGKNLFSEVENKYIFSEKFIDRQQAVITKDWKLIVFNEEDVKNKHELYKIKDDPNEVYEVSSDYPEVVKELTEAIDNHNKERKLYKTIEFDLPMELNEEERKRLIETGYF